MGSLIDDFLRQTSAEDRRELTLDQYGGNLIRCEKWLMEHYGLALSEEQIGGVTGMMLTKFYQSLHERGLKVSTRNAYVIAIKKFFGFLKAAQVIYENPSAVLRCIREKQRRTGEDTKMYSGAEIQKLMESLADDPSHRNALRYAAIIALILGSGLRAFELCSLNVSDAKRIHEGVISVERKGGSWYDVHIADFVDAHVARYLLTRRKARPEEPLFLSQKGNRMTPNAVWQTLATKQKQLNLHTGVHRFRHTFLSDVEHNQNHGAALARDLAGHKSIQTTDAYLHTSVQERKEAVNHMGYSKHLSV